LRAAGAGAIVAACGTGSSTVLDRLSVDCPLPLFGAAMPLARGVAQACDGRSCPRVLLLATEGSVRAKGLERLILSACPRARVRALAAPDFVPLAERLTPENEGATEAAIARILSPLAKEAFDLVALGCTHFSALAGMISRALGDLPICDGATLCAREAAGAMAQKKRGTQGRTQLYTSGDPSVFARAAARILGQVLPVRAVL
jgi:glutamate racemase